MACGSRVLVTTDGSWCEVDPTPGWQWRPHVREGGPTPIWAQVEHAHQQWQDWGRPGWERVGVTARPETATFWLDAPDDRIGCI